MGEMINTYKVLVGKPVIVDGKIISRCFLRKYIKRMQDFINLPQDRDNLRGHKN
jgi:hypothetical protein